MPQLTTYEWLYGISQIAAIVLSIIAGMLSLWLIKQAKHEYMRAWKYLGIALTLFTIEELLGMMRTFDIYNTSLLEWLPEGIVSFLTTAATHVVPFFILVFLITALIIQTNIKKGWTN
ncbi:hypothetical protein HY486_01070 [Candidatus Woesearchaeota archaeon]|nr:hypothetical protein [Candidatus Woesearchaeota archaeon]